MTTRGAAAASESGLPPIRVLPIPESRPPALPSDVVASSLALALDRDEDHHGVQDMLAFESMPRRSDRQRDARGVERADPTQWVRGTAQAIVEIMAGLRHPSHVVRLCAPEVYVAIARRHASSVRRTAAGQGTRVRRMQVTRVITCRPAPDAAECTVILATGGRARAMALRAEFGLTGWRITALELA